MTDPRKPKPYGYSLVLDMHGCDVNKFNRITIGTFLRDLATEILHVEPCDLHFWDDVGVPDDEKQTDPKTQGTSACLFIITSNITIHTLDQLGSVYLDVFSCNKFDPIEVYGFACAWFRAQTMEKHFIERTAPPC